MKISENSTNFFLKKQKKPFSNISASYNKSDKNLYNKTITKHHRLLKVCKFYIFFYYCNYNFHYIFHKRSIAEVKGPYDSNKDSRYLELILVVDKETFEELDSDLMKVNNHCQNVANTANMVI